MSVTRRNVLASLAAAGGAALLRPPLLLAQSAPLTKPIPSTGETLPLIGLALTALAVVLAVRVWREKYWTGGSRVLHTAGVASAIAFVWFLNFWNLLGYRVG